MLVVDFNIETKRGKNLEFMQSIGSLIVGLRRVKGCMSIDFEQNSEDKHQLNLRLTWLDIALFKALLLREEYDIFEGAIGILCAPPIVEIKRLNAIIRIDMRRKQTLSLRNVIISKLKLINEELV